MSETTSDTLRWSRKIFRTGQNVHLRAETEVRQCRQVPCLTVLRIASGPNICSRYTEERKCRDDFPVLVHEDFWLLYILHILSLTRRQI